MPIPDSQLRACLATVGQFLEKRRPPLHIRDKLDLRVDITGGVVVVFEVRPSFQDKSKIRDIPVAKAKWVGTRNTWRLFWMRADMKWHSYPPLPEAQDIGTLFAEIDRDPHGCFWG
jgi:hypothetical protein